MSKRGRDPAKEVFWRDALARQAASRLSAREFCQRERLTESAFYFWRRTIHDRDAAPRETIAAGSDIRDARRVARISAKAPETERRRAKQPAFVPAIVNGRGVDIETPRETAITIELAGGRALRLAASFPIERLAELVYILESRGPR